MPSMPSHRSPGRTALFKHGDPPSYRSLLRSLPPDLQVCESQRWLFAICAGGCMQIWNYADGLEEAPLCTVESPYSKAFCMRIIGRYLYCGGLDTRLHYVPLEHLISQNGARSPPVRPKYFPGIDTQRSPKV